MANSSTLTRTACPSWCSGYHDGATFDDAEGTYTRRHRVRRGAWLLCDYTVAEHAGGHHVEVPQIEWRPVDGVGVEAIRARDDLLALIGQCPGASVTFSYLVVAAEALGISMIQWAEWLDLAGATDPRPALPEDLKCPSWCETEAHRVLNAGERGHSVAHEWKRRTADAVVTVERVHYLIDGTEQTAVLLDLGSSEITDVIALRDALAEAQAVLDAEAAQLVAQ